MALLRVLAMAVYVSHVIDVTLATHRGDQASTLPLRIVPSVSRYEAPAPVQVYDPGSDLSYYNGYDQAPLNFAPQVHTGQGLGHSCYKVPLSTYFNISDNSYFYPKNNIYQELTQRKDILEDIFKNGVKVISPSSEKGVLFNPSSSDLQSSVGDGVHTDGLYAGCTGYRLLLRSFDAYGGHCWVVYPRHQAKSFVSCGAPKCQGDRGYGGYSACATEEVTVGVWAWCETLPYGKRITKIDLPLPVACRCQVYDC